MNEENRKENLREEIDRAVESMKAADLLFDHGFVRDAVGKRRLPVIARLPNAWNENDLPGEEGRVKPLVCWESNFL